MTSSVSLENTDTAIATSADIARLHLARIIGNRNHTTSEMRKASLAVYGIRWNRDVLTTLSTDRINHDLARLRHSEFPEKEYERSPSFLKESYSASSSSPVELLEWRTLAAQIRLDLSEGWEAVLQAATFLHSRGLSTPFHLGALSQLNFTRFRRFARMRRYSALFGLMRVLLRLPLPRGPSGARPFCSR